MTGRSLNEFTCGQSATQSRRRGTGFRAPLPRRGDDVSSSGSATREAPRLIEWRRGRVVLSRARALRAKTFPRHSVQLQVTINLVTTRRKRPRNSVFRIAIDVKRRNFVEFKYRMSREYESDLYARSRRRNGDDRHILF